MENSAHTLPSDPAICVSSVVFCFLRIPLAAEPHNVSVICREKTIICLSEKGYRVIFPHSHCMEIKCLSSSQTATRYQPGCCFPKENSWAARRQKELSLASEWISGVPPAELSTSPCQSYYQPGSWGEPWGNPSLDMNWMEGKEVEGEARIGMEESEGDSESERGG